MPRVLNKPRFWRWHDFVCKVYAEFQICMIMASYASIIPENASVCLNVPQCAWIWLIIVEWPWICLKIPEYGVVSNFDTLIKVFGHKYFEHQNYNLKLQGMFKIQFLVNTNYLQNWHDIIIMLKIILRIYLNK